MSQGFLINGGNLVIQNGTSIVLSGNAGWTNNATVNCAAGSWVRFSGNARQTISGSQLTTFDGLFINNSHADGVWLARAIGVNTTLQMNLGHFNLRDYITTLGATAVITGETETRRIRATSAAGTEGLGTGTIRTTRTNPSGNVANLGFNFTPAAALGNTLIIRGHERQQGSGSFTGNYSVFRYYELQPASLQALTSYNFSYWDAELNGHIEANLEAFERAQYYWGGWGGPVYWEPRTSTPVPASQYVTSNASVNALTYIRVTLGSTTTPLPVSLVNFSGECKENQVVLQWQTLAEINNNFFSLWRSENGLDYSFVDFISAAGNSSEVNSYSYNDPTPVNETVYYKLTQTDYDNTVTELSITAVTCQNSMSEDNFQIFHGNGQLIVNLEGTPGENYTLKFTNLLGQTFYAKQILLDEKTKTLNLDDSGFAAGMYFVTLESATNRLSKQIVISF
ncbi:MAG: hypothetical protein CVU05_00895 [Bacteroidetes bacterium HGW-Bacteroidetes-21]|nr:MAG: hypothetical protein CVU05_00895 [Bacteroidetes bacterium HGW-Bacteroidetes-21]